MSDSSSSPLWVRSPEVQINLNLPFARRYAEVPDSILQMGRHLLDVLADDIPQKARALAPLVRLRTANRFHAEALALARHVGSSWQEITVANIVYDLVLSAFGCSTIALPGPDGPVIARNMDWAPETVLARCSCLMTYQKHGVTKFINAGWPGAIGVVTGLSARGFAIVLNAVRCEEPFQRFGYPVLLHLRRVLEDATDFDHALQLLSHQKLTTGALITLVGTENHQRVCIERSPTRFALRWPETGGVLVTTNDYRKLFEPLIHDNAEIFRTTCSRFDHLTRFFADHVAGQPVKDEKLLYVLTDPGVIQGITAQHIILHPTSGSVRLFVPTRLLAADASR
ncbi:MAG: C45 family peptidase [Planctomycetaceae bacterium]